MTTTPAHHTRPADGAAEAQAVRDQVRSGYAKIATSKEPGGGGCCGPACCGGESGRLSEMVGYQRDALDVVPDGADMGLSCGNPTALASLAQGEVVLDLGSGGGLDVFIAGSKVGARGRAIGVDMTPEMLGKARAGVAEYRRRTGLDNVEFRLGEIEHLPVADASVDVVISNCVINLSPDKPQVWREIARVLRPGGRVAVSDLVQLRPLPGAVREMLEAWVGCIAGASLIDDVRRMAESAGLTLHVTPRPDYVRALADMQDPLYRRIAAALPPGTALEEFVTSADISGRKRAT